MSTFSKLTIDGGDMIPINSLNLNFFKKISELTSLPTSGILGGTVELTMIFEEESDNNTFFASWFQESGKEHDVDIEWSHIAGNQEKFLSMKLSKAQCVQYNVTHKFDSNDLNPSVENSILLVLLVSPSITIGQATLQAGVQ
jgi:hypothetical protein